jgi:hypothetical protein
MKTTLHALFLCVVHQICLAQPESFTWDIHKMTPEDLHSKLKEMVHQTSLVEPRLSLINDAIAAQRLDLVHAAFTNSFATMDTFFKIKAMPDSEFRRKVAIMMIRVPKSSAWLPDEMPGIYKSPRGNGVQEPFITTVEALLPGQTLVPEMVVNSQARFTLADRLYAAMEAKGVQFTDAEKTLLQADSSSAAPVAPPVPAPQPNTPAVKPSPTAARQESPAPAISTAPAELAQESGVSGTPAFWIPVVGLVAAVGWWLAARKKA